MIVDGGNSNFRDSQRRSEEAKKKGVAFLDAGVSGGIWGLKEGYCVMVGGDAAAYKQIEPFIEDLTEPGGHAHVGASGAGHFVKMVHNGIEYGMMQSLAEGFEIMQASEFSPNLHKVAALWQHGSVVRSWLLDLLVLALEEDPDLEKIRGYVDDSGEGRWTVVQRDRRVGARAGDHDGALRPLRLPAGRVVRREGERRAPQPVRRARGQGRRREVAMPTQPAPRRACASRACPTPASLVIFGASGDLTRRKLFPAIWSLAVRDLLPEQFAIVGVARTEGPTPSSATG